MDLLAVGVITATHGVGGELKVKSFSGEPQHIVALKEAIFRKGAAERRLRIEGARPQPPGVILKLEGMSTPETARQLIGYELWVPRRQAAPLASGEYYAADLCRCTVWFGDERIGEVRSVWDGGPSQLLEVTGTDGKMRLVPFLEHFIREVDLAAGRITLREDEIVR